MRRQVEGDKPPEWFCWGLCAVTFAHTLAYFGVSDWDATQIWWFAFLAMVSAAAVALKAEKESQAVEEPPFDLATTV